MREHVSVIANGTIAHNANEVIISFYGPRGGTRSIESISIESAKELRDQLSKAIDKIENGSN